MKVLIVDDEPTMLLTMERLLATIEGIEIVGRFQRAEEAYQFLCHEEVDLAFLDIEIADDNGIELARDLRMNAIEVDIVFTTSHTSYAIEAFDIYALDYMVKPISKERLIQTLKRAQGRRSVSTVGTLPLIHRLKVRMLGTFEVNSTDQGTVKWISKKSEELFAYLLVNRGNSVAKMKVIEDIFPNMPQKNAENYLNTAVYQLRKALSLHNFKEIVISGNEKYNLTLTHVDVDFIQLEQGIALLATIQKNNEAVAMELERQVEGEFLENHAFVWAVPQRESINILCGKFMNNLASWLLSAKRYPEALQIMRKNSVRNPFDETAHRLLLTIYGEMGDRYALHNQYQEYVRMMKQELGLEPSESIVQLYSDYK